MNDEIMDRVRKEVDVAQENEDKIQEGLDKLYAPPQEGWEATFDARFSPEWWTGFSNDFDLNQTAIEGIKSFISDLLMSEREKQYKVYSEMEAISVERAVRAERQRLRGAVEKLRGRLEKIAWKNYDPEASINVEEMLDEMMPVLLSLLEGEIKQLD